VEDPTLNATAVNRLEEQISVAVQYANNTAAVDSSVNQAFVIPDREDRIYLQTVSSLDHEE